MQIKKYKCHFCPECHGEGCIDELPGMGGFNNSVNFLLNCEAWKKLFIKYEIEIQRATAITNQNQLNRTETPLIDELANFSTDKAAFINTDRATFTDKTTFTDQIPAIRLAPITGGVENIGYKTERDFYFDMQEAAFKSGAKLSIGDGCPDEKILGGIEAVKQLQEKYGFASASQTTKNNQSIKAAVFIKPYPNDKIIERIQWSKPIAESIGVDIDSYNIVTMRNLVKLERKTPAQIKELKHHSGLPFSIKGVFTDEDIELVKEVKPEIVVISNHGGRVENRIGSTAEFLETHAKELKKYCKELWVDGGLRTFQDLQVAKYLGADEVMLGRPFITALCLSSTPGVCKMIKEITQY